MTRDDDGHDRIKTEEYRDHAAELRAVLNDEQVARVERKVREGIEECLSGELGGPEDEDVEFYVTIALGEIRRDELTEQEAVEYVVDWAVSSMTHEKAMQEWFGSAAWFIDDYEAKKEARLYTRPRGFLTEHDRQYLDGLVSDDELSENAENHQRYRIRERAKNALMDFQHLVHLRQDDLERIVRGLFRSDSGRVPPEDVALWDGIRAAFHFLFAALGREAFEDLATDAFAVGIERMYEQRYREHVDVDVSFHVDISDPKPLSAPPAFEETSQKAGDEKNDTVSRSYPHSRTVDEYKYWLGDRWEGRPFVGPVYWDDDDAEPNPGVLALNWRRRVLRSTDPDE